jgi:hypothetical protein
MSAVKKRETENVPGWQIYGRVDGVTPVEEDMVVRLKSAVIWARDQVLMGSELQGRDRSLDQQDHDDIPRYRCMSLISSEY